MGGKREVAVVAVVGGAVVLVSVAVAVVVAGAVAGAVDCGRQAGPTVGERRRSMSSTIAVDAVSCTVISSEWKGRYDGRAY